MSEERQGIDIYETNRFSKKLESLPSSHQEIVEDQIDVIIKDPNIGQQKRGDLSYLRVHKFKLESQLCLLGYHWVEDKLELYLLQLGFHENFYDDTKKRRKADLKIIK